MNQQDKQVVSFPKEREQGLREVSERIGSQINSLPTSKEKDLAWACLETLTLIQPGPRVSRMIGEFLIDFANEIDKNDKKYGTDSNNENQVVCVVRPKKEP